MLVKAASVHKRTGAAVKIYHAESIRSLFNLGVATGYDRIIQLYIHVPTPPQNQSTQYPPALNYAFTENDGSRNPERLVCVWIGSNSLSKAQGDWAQNNLISEFERSLLGDSHAIHDRAALAAQVLNRP